VSKWVLSICGRGRLTEVVIHERATVIRGVQNMPVWEVLSSRVRKQQMCILFRIMTHSASGKFLHIFLFRVTSYLSRYGFHLLVKERVQLF
jgi:hypothetical protein